MCGLPILGLLVTNYVYSHASEMGGSGEGVVLALKILPSSSFKQINYQRSVSTFLRSYFLDPLKLNYIAAIQIA